MSVINKFGNSSSTHLHSSALKTSLSKTLGISVSNHSLDVHRKKICNLGIPTDPDDAVSKVYVRRLMKNFEGAVDTLESSVTLQLSTIKHSIEELRDTTMNEIYNEINRTELALKAHFMDKKKTLFKTIEDRLDKREEYIFKWVGAEDFQKKISSELSNLTENLKKLEENINKSDKTNKMFEGLKNRIDTIEDYLFKIIGSNRENVKQEKPIRVIPPPEL